MDGGAVAPGTRFLRTCVTLREPPGAAASAGVTDITTRSGRTIVKALVSRELFCGTGSSATCPAASAITRILYEPAETFGIRSDVETWLLSPPLKTDTIRDSARATSGPVAVPAALTGTRA